MKISWCSSFALAAASGFALLLSMANSLALTAGKDVEPGDIGARAQVRVLYRGDEICGGVVIGDRYVITAAHCLTGTKGALLPSLPGALSVKYWADGGSLHANAVDNFIVHESYIDQERNSKSRVEDHYRGVQHEDIAILQLRARHPKGAVSAAIPRIKNDYTYNGKDEELGQDIWFFVYGNSVEGAPGRLQRALASDGRALFQTVIPGKKPDLFYTVRKQTVHVKAYSTDFSVCMGDSGSGVFLVDGEGVQFDEKERPRKWKFPSGKIAEEEGQPVVIGLNSNTWTKEKGDVRCGREVGDKAFAFVRVDYYRDWIMSAMKRMGK